MARVATLADAQESSRNEDGVVHDAARDGDMRQTAPAHVAKTFVVTPELLGEPERQKPLRLQPLETALQWSVRSGEASLEYVWNRQMPIVKSGHGFIAAIVTAWLAHLPLVLKPEHIWLLILQGISG